MTDVYNLLELTKSHFVELCVKSPQMYYKCKEQPVVFYLQYQNNHTSKLPATEHNNSAIVS